MTRSFYAVLAAAAISWPAMALAQQEGAAGNQDQPRASQNQQGNQDQPRANQDQPRAENQNNQGQPQNAQQGAPREGRQAPPRPEPAADVLRDPGQRPDAQQLPQQGNLQGDRAPRAGAAADADAGVTGRANVQDAPNVQGDVRTQQQFDRRDGQQRFDNRDNFDARQQFDRRDDFNAQQQFDRREADHSGHVSGQGDDQNRWRFKWHNNVWWYWTPQNNWVVWIDNQWQPYSPGMFSSSNTGSYATESYSSPSYSYSSPSYSYSSPSYGYSYPSYNYGYSYPSYGYNRGYNRGYYGGSGVYLNFGSPRYSSGYRGYGGYPGYGYGGSRFGGYDGYGRSGAGFSTGRGGVGFGIRF
jgi:hypothetical protein